MLILKITIVIPTYWSRESKERWKKGDIVYDHPTPLDQEGTLRRTLESINILKDKGFHLLVIAVPTAKDIENQVEHKVQEILNSSSVDVNVSLFAPSHLKKLHRLLIQQGQEKYVNFLQLRGYANVRNLCLLIAHVMEADLAILIDDDEVFEDPLFLSKAQEFIGKTVGNQQVNAVAGYYLQPDNDYHISAPSQLWMKYWDKYEKMNEAFDKIIGQNPRLKKTPFAFGGNMILHRNLFTSVPFDPYIHRGEDIDYLINARMFGFHFFLDNQLSIRHLPPPKTHPLWMRLREDIYRFIYERTKIEKQKRKPEMTMVRPEDFDPYPGCFLRNDLEEKIENACTVLSQIYLEEGDEPGSNEALRNISLAKSDAIPSFDPFEWLCNFQKQWKNFMSYIHTSSVRKEMQKILS